jgi:dipeptidyl-peptidase 4
MVDRIRRGEPFEGHRTILLEGGWARGAAEQTSSDWFVVRTGQSLGVLAAYLLEPASDDGVVTWNLLDPELAPGRPYPILRSRQPLAAAADD